jgi:hypothetical protein
MHRLSEIGIFGKIAVDGSSSVFFEGSAQTHKMWMRGMLHLFERNFIL